MLEGDYLIFSLYCDSLVCKCQAVDCNQDSISGWNISLHCLIQKCSGANLVTS